MEHINYLNIGCTLTIKNRRRGTLWYCLCSKTKKIAMVSITPVWPFIVTGTHIQDGKCFDGSSCLNTDCKYCENNTMKEALDYKRLGLTEKEGEDFINNRIHLFWEGCLKEWVKENEELLEEGGLIPEAFELKV